LKVTQNPQQHRTSLVISKLRADGEFTGWQMGWKRGIQNNTYINQRYKSQTCTQINETAPIHKETPPKEKQTAKSTQPPKHKGTTKSPKEPHTNYQNTNPPNFKVESGWWIQRVTTGLRARNTPVSERAEPKSTEEYSTANQLLLTILDEWYK
jgi:hypothetical protein